MGSSETEYQKTEYYSPNGIISKFEDVLIDYYSKESHPTPFYILEQDQQGFPVDEIAIKTELGKTIKIVLYKQLPGWTIIGTIEENYECLSVIQFEKYPKFVRIRFIILIKSKSTLIKQIANEIVTKWLLLGYSILPFDLANEEELKAITSEHEGISVWRERRANLFKELKDKNPHYSKTRLAIQATITAKDRIRADIDKNYKGIDPNEIETIILKQFIETYGNGKEKFSKDDVTNDYKLKNWTWLNSRDIS